MDNSHSVRIGLPNKLDAIVIYVSLYQDTNAQLPGHTEGGPCPDGNSARETHIESLEGSG